jgi:hypothetical protein
MNVLYDEALTRGAHKGVVFSDAIRVHLNFALDSFLIQHANKICQNSTEQLNLYNIKNAFKYGYDMHLSHN